MRYAGGVARAAWGLLRTDSRRDTYAALLLVGALLLPFLMDAYGGEQ